MSEIGTPDGKTFFGQPIGVAYLAFTEAWERFSYYGMTALVVLYMVQQLLLPGHIEHVAGMAGFRHALEGVFGPLSSQALASQIFGFYTGFVYFTPIIGGFVADRWLGARRTVLIGAGVMSVGHFLMAFELSFLLAILLLIIGTGCLKGNISAQVGRLHPPEDEAGRTRSYAVFSMGINVGAVCGPLGCGLVAQLYGWHYGFGLAGVMMVLAASTYLAGARHLPPEAPRRRDRAPAEPLTPAQRRTVAMLLLLMVVSIFQSVCYYQISNVGLVWVSEHAALGTPLGDIPVSWFNSIDSLASIVFVPPLVALWRWQGMRGRESGDVAKIGIGAALAAASALLLAFGAAMAGSGHVTVLLPLVAFTGMGIAFLYYWPTLLALVSQSAPARLNATLMGTVFLSLFVSNLIIGWFGGYYEPLGPTMFWLVDAAIGGVGALLILVFGRVIHRALQPAAIDSIVPSA
jgi:POT family proton-dependent oligopeptide transporter